ncbi:MAG: signal recognition particle protein [Candidatus Aenigmarchaeota archaeon]|nr:signal recognition particle protein [Candidatus Aenigmarchaeota archaeon]
MTISRKLLLYNEFVSEDLIFLLHLVVMLSGLSQKLRDAIDRFSRGGANREEVDELVREIQRSLISADVDVQLVLQLSESIKKQSFEKMPAGLTRREHVVRVVYEELAEIMGREKSAIALKPKKILLAGLYGSGKTTTAAKLARFYQKKGLKTALICCDTVRPAAYEQLKQLAEKIDAEFYGEKGEKDSAAVLRNALKKVRGDVIIVDSSGRNALDGSLIEEIKEIDSLLNPDERILVIPADIGQAANEQATAFSNALHITDVIVTKLDATAKGGGALTACYQTRAKVIFVTVGETPEDLEQYDPKKFVARLLGFPDLEALLEKAKTAVDEEKAKKVVSGDFTIEEFYEQIESVQKMGPLSQIMDMMGLGKMSGKVPGGVDVHEAKMKKWGHIIKSMTREEKSSPDIINPSRVSRIARGSGTSESEVRELLSNYGKIKKMMKKMSPSKLKRSGLFRKFGLR